MIAKQNRFHGRGGVPFVLRKGRHLSRGSLRLAYYQVNKPRALRIAVIVSKKIDKRAPVRNRLRRQIFEQLRPILPILPLGFDLVFSVKKKPGKDDDITTDVSQLLLDLSNKIDKENKING